MKMKILVAAIVAVSTPAVASMQAPRSADAGGVNGNGKSNGAWCADSIPVPTPLFTTGFGIPCWAYEQQPW